MNFSFRNITLISSLISRRSEVLSSFSKSFDAKELLKLRQNPAVLITRKHPLLNLEPRSKSTLPAQISGIIGAYILSVIIVCIIIYILASRLRNKQRVAHDTLDAEKIESQLPENLNTNELPSAETKAFLQKLKEEGDQATKITSPSHGLLLQNNENLAFDMQVIGTDREVLSRDLEEVVYAHVLAQEEAKVNQTTSTNKPFLSFILPAIHNKIKATFKRQPYIYENKVSCKSHKATNSKVFTRAIPRFSSSLSRFKLSKIEKKSLRNLKISLPVPQPSTQWSTISCDQITSAMNQSFVDSFPQITGDNFHESLQLFSAGSPGQDIEKNLPSLKLPDSFKSHQSSDPLNPKFVTRLLPLRKYESSSQSPTPIFAPTKTTVLERVGFPSYLENGSLEIPKTAGSIPYSPYQPRSMTIPITPTFVTREEKKRRKKLKSRIPSFELVKSEAEIWDDAYDLRKIDAKNNL
ncbi:hypothetical protein OnM2_015029 [Erysiphe neolycopersici]|uniref:Uncharacterized protein n=1 Tax=Erysiphe neolycopersici TaxID=212602 RepID=A0A420I5C3_9PEZI|nr:hypothetical protein OnM2_015029 [Erysiphe neolycopersici]